MTHLCQADGTNQITHWWHEVEEAVRSGQIPRARRFLRWIVTCCPEEEEGWLVLARLMGSSQEQIPILKSAYRFHPRSQRVQAALREARQHQLELGVGELKSRWLVPPLLPDERQISAPAHSGNGHRPAAGNGYHPTQPKGLRRLWPPPFLDHWPGRRSGR
ncbi:MAG: hypothetical protein P8129_10170 [Anaerolineae bacterium]